MPRQWLPVKGQSVTVTLFGVLSSFPQQKDHDKVVYPQNQERYFLTNEGERKREAQTDTATYSRHPLGAIVFSPFSESRNVPLLLTNFHDIQTKK